MAFRGHYEHSLDAKNRLSIPARFRAAFSSGVVLAKWLEPCVTIWTPQAFEGLTAAALADLNPISERYRRLSRYFRGNAFDVELDAAGRVTLNPALLSHAGAEKEVVVVGVGDHLEVWDRERWLAEDSQLDSTVLEAAEGLGG